MAWAEHELLYTDFALDPSAVVSALAKQDITTEE